VREKNNTPLNQSRPNKQNKTPAPSPNSRVPRQGHNPNYHPMTPPRNHLYRDSLNAALWVLHVSRRAEAVVADTVEAADTGYTSLVVERVAGVPPSTRVSEE